MQEQTRFKETASILREMLAMLIKTNGECEFMLECLMRNGMINPVELDRLVEDLQRKMKPLLTEGAKPSETDRLLNLLRAFEGPIQ